MAREVGAPSVLGDLRGRARRSVERISILLRRAGYLRKWLILGTVIGLVGGLGAIAFNASLRWAGHLFLGILAGYRPPAPFGEGATMGSGSHLARPWAIPLVTGLGGLISGLLVFRFAPEAEGHGTDAAIAAVHHNPRGIRARVAFVKIAASAITIGSGGSAGREGPTAQISAGFGSMLARWLDLTPRDARMAVTVGIASGIGAIFRAPLGGAVLGAEILYRDDVEAEALVPSLVASIVAFAAFGAVEGFSPIFGASEAYRFRHPAELGAYGLLGLVAGLVGRLYARAFYGAIRLRRRLPGADLWKPAIGGLLVGLLALAMPQVLGTGYGWVQLAMGPGLLSLPLWLVIALPFAKILATSLSIGSGGSGGIFGPGMVIGGFTGAALWRLLHGLPAVPQDPAPFVVVGMIACFGSVAHAPLAVMLMVAEMTGTLEMLAPAMVAVGIAAAVVGDATIYENQLRNRMESPAHRVRFGMPLLATIPVTEAMRPPRLVLDERTPVREAAELMVTLGLPRAPVASPRGTYRGTVALDELGKADPGRDIAAVADATAPAVPVHATLEDVMEVLAAEHVISVPVLDGERRVAGVVGMGELVAAYRRALLASLRGLRTVFAASIFVEERIHAEAPVVGRTVADAGWPPGTVVVALQRGEELIFPDPSTVLRAGDLLSLVTPAAAERAVRALVGEPEDGGPPERAGPDLV
ncbi:MAG TPA: chloride channel protein [Actinomycetota bacterium]|nr:chloride channel protein [Actinomycetota bacterium]